MPRRWLVKTEPSDYAFSDLVRQGRTTWDGVANALAQRHLRAMETGDLVVVYHTGREKAVAGLARVATSPRPDPASPRGKGVSVDLVPVKEARAPVPLSNLKADPRLRGFDLLRLPRLSVMPVPDEAWAALASLAGF